MSYFCRLFLAILFTNINVGAKYRKEMTVCVTI